MKIIKGTIDVEKLITKAEYARRQGLTSARISQLVAENRLPEGYKIVVIQGAEFIKLP